MVLVREQVGRVGEEIDATRRVVFYTPLFVARAWVGVWLACGGCVLETRARKTESNHTRRASLGQALPIDIGPKLNDADNEDGRMLQESVREVGRFASMGDGLDFVSYT